MTNPTTTIALKNNTGSSNAYAYITGLDLNNNNVPLFIQADGKTVYHPASPAEPQQALQADCAIPLGDAGSTQTLTVPQIAGGRIWFSAGSKLTFLLNPGPSVVEPAVTNAADPNYGLSWGFCEFTYNSFQLFVNISYVDFVSPLPVALELRNTAGDVQTVRGLPASGLDTVCDKLTQQGGDWAKLVVRDGAGKNLRALSPNAARVADPSLFDGYYQPYVDAVWAKYASEDLVINTQAQWGDVTGRVDASTGLLTFGDFGGTFAQPAAADVFSCSTGPFGSYPAEHADEMGAIGARVAAALNRSTLLANARQPDGEVVSSYYTTEPTNHYARVCHEVNLDGRGYAFPYDDVVAAGDTQPDQAGTVFDQNPELLTVTIGGPAGTVAAAAADGVGEADGERQKVVGGVKEKDNEKEEKTPAAQQQGSGAKSFLGGVKSRLSSLKRKLLK